MRSSGAYDNAQEYFPGAGFRVGKDGWGLGILLSHISLNNDVLVVTDKGVQDNQHAEPPRRHRKLSPIF